METTEKKVDLSTLSSEEKAALLAELQKEDRQSRQERRDTYEGLRAAFMQEVKAKVLGITDEVQGFHQWLTDEVKGFTAIMKEYGQVKTDDQRSFTITDGDFRIEVKSNKVKGFDERADLAAERLIDYLEQYVNRSERGTSDPMYQMAMTLLERNKMGDLDYKSISKLYSLEDKFDDEYAQIMSLFKEANVVQKTAVNYYFQKLNPETGVWRRIEPSFCRL